MVPENPTSDNRQDTVITPLAARPDAAADIAAWTWTEWGWMHPELSETDWLRRWQERARQQTGIPSTVVALTAGTPVGTASLVRYDMDTHRHLSPWLAAVYVKPSCRHRAVGRRLVNRVTEEAGRMDIDTLYLFTPDKQHFYERLGWRVLDRVVYKGQRVCIMSVNALRRRCIAVGAER